jgi:hypothetical protein
MGDSAVAEQLAGPVADHLVDFDDHQLALNCERQWLDAGSISANWRVQ